MDTPGLVSQVLIGHDHSLIGDQPHTFAFFLNKVIIEKQEHSVVSRFSAKPVYRAMVNATCELVRVSNLLIELQSVL